MYTYTGNINLWEIYEQDRTSIWEIHGKYMGICVKDDVYCARIYGEIYGNMGNLWGYIWEIHGKHVGTHMWNIGKSIGMYMWMQKAKHNCARVCTNLGWIKYAEIFWDICRIKTWKRETKWHMVFKCEIRCCISGTNTPLWIPVVRWVAKNFKLVPKHHQTITKNIKSGSACIALSL